MAVSAIVWQEEYMLTIEQIPLGQLRPNPNNPRRNDDAVDAVARSIQTFGFNSPIITDTDLNIAAGHTRLKAAQKLGLEAVPVIRIPGLTGTRLTGFMIADNKTAEIAEWDEEILTRLVAELNLDDDFDLGSLGFDDKELTELLDASLDEDERDREDEAPDLPEDPRSRPGDIYTLGDHRLVCGDSTDRTVLSELMDGAKVDCLITDPPYGVSYMSRGEKGEQWGAIANDELSPDALEDFLLRVFRNVAGVSRSGVSAYVFHAMSAGGVRIAFERAFMGSGFELSATIVWAKQSATMGWGDYRHQCEPILYGWRGEGHRKIKDRTQTTVWRIDREPALVHPTQKPVALISRAIRNSTVRGELVVDPFLGSGTTLIACEQLGRKCYGIEIEPKYCDVIVQRWEKYTGRKAGLARSAS